MTKFRFLALSLLATLAMLPPKAAAQAPDYRRHTSRDLQAFGSDEAFLAYLAEARAAAYARGDWWTRDPEAPPAGSGENAPESENEAGPPPAEPEKFGFGLEVLPGSHGDYNVEEHMLPDGSTLFYSTLDLADIRPGADAGMVWPGFRRRGLVRAGDEDGGWAEERRQLEHAARNPLYRLGDIVRPVRDTLESTVHALTICPREAMEQVRASLCRTTAFVAPRGGELHVTPTYIYLWTMPEYGDIEAFRTDPDCRARTAAIAEAGIPTQIHRLPVGGGALEVIGVRGQLAWRTELQAGAGRLRALATSEHIACTVREDKPLNEPPAWLGLVDVPLTRFATRLGEAPVPAPMPQVGASGLQAGFSGDWLFYGAGAYNFSVPYEGDVSRSGRLLAVPLARPRETQAIDLPHDIVSITPAGRHLLIAGYRDPGSIELSVVSAGDRPRIVSRARLEGRALARDRHPITVQQAPNGSVRIALPTIDPNELYASTYADPNDHVMSIDPPMSPRHLILDAEGQIRLVE